MRKTILAGFLILFTVSCAPLMEETWTVTTPEGPVTVRHNDPARELLLGFYIADLINPPKTHNNLLLSSYYYPLIIPRVQKFGTLPTWEDVLYDMKVESAIEDQLRDYERRIQSINDMETWKLKMDTQRMIDNIESANERAKDELERKKQEAEDAADELKDAADDTKLELENAAWWAKFMESAVADAEVARLVAENANVETRVLSDKRKTLSTEEFFPSMKKETSEKSTDFDFSFLDDGRLPSEDQVEVTQWFGPSAGKKFVSVGVDYAQRAQGLYFSVEPALLGPDDPSNLLYSGEIAVYGNWSDGGKEKEISRIVKNGLANAIKEIIDELGER